MQTCSNKAFRQSCAQCITSAFVYPRSPRKENGRRTEWRMIFRKQRFSASTQLGGVDHFAEGGRKGEERDHMLPRRPDRLIAFLPFASNSSWRNNAISAFSA